MPVRTFGNEGRGQREGAEGEASGAKRGAQGHEKDSMREQENNACSTVRIARVLPYNKDQE